MPRRLVIAASAAASLLAASTAVGGTISGQVFRDYNSNAVKNAGGYVGGQSVTATDTSVEGVTVRAFDNAGNKVGETTSAPDGTYSLNVSGSGTVRVEFSTPVGYQPSFDGTQAGTSVQFVNAAGASNVDYAVNLPSEYCQDNPDLITCLQQATGMAEQPAYAGKPGAFTVPSAFYDTPDISAAGAVRSAPASEIVPDSSIVAPFSSFGASFGVGVDRDGNAYYGTYVKRHSPYGPEGAVNAVYKVNVATGAASTFVTLGNATLPEHAQAAPNGWPDYAADGYRSVTTPSDPNYSDVYSKVGRAGLGDVDVTADGSTLLAVEMTEGAPKLWSVPINGAGAGTTAGAPTSTAIPTPATFNGVSCIGEYHPMGLGHQGSDVFVGGVCGAETQRITNITQWAASSGTVTITTDAPHGMQPGDTVSIGGIYGNNTLQGNNGGGILTSHVLEACATPSATTFCFTNNAMTDESGTVPAGAGLFAGPTNTALFVQRLDTTSGTFTTVYSQVISQATMPSANNNGNAFREATFGNGPGLQGASNGQAVWTSWDDSFSDFSPPGQMLLANIEVLQNGDLVLGTRDRGQDQSKAGSIDYNSTPGSPVITPNPVSAGAIIRLCKQLDGSFDREYDGACGTNTGAQWAPQLSSSSVRGPGLPTPQSLRPDSLLYYMTNFNEPNGSPASSHTYTSLGGLATMPGVTTMWSTNYDANDYRTQGFKAYGPCPVGATGCGPTANDGAIVGIAQVGWGSGGQPSQGGASFGKGNGLGDLELVCDAAPLQIGNRIWIDTNKDGIQDPDEPVAAGVTVHLYDAGGTLVGTAITNANGEYYFASNVSKPVAGDGGNVGGGLVKDQAFTIKLDNAADFTTGGPLAGLVPTKANATSTDPAANGTAINSKATLVGSAPTIDVAPRRPGFNNHTFDAGFITDPNAGGNTPVGMGDYTWIDVNRNGIQDPGEPPLPGVKVQLLTPGGQVARDFNGNPVGPVITNAQGYYFIDNLACGDYTAQFTIPTGYAFTKAGAGVPGTDSNPNSINGFVGTTPAFTIACSATGNTTPFAGNPKALFANLTIDAGVVPVVAIGNFVWFDANKDGVQGKREKPVKGAKVYLLRPDGTRAKDAYGRLVPVATTDKKGRYLFQGLMPGDYRVKFVYPKGYSGTISGRGNYKNGSNPKVSPLSPRIGLTGVFAVFDKRKGNTVPQLDPKVNAKFIDPTIDAGLVPGTGPAGVVG